MKIATKDLKDEALLWAAVKVTWPNDHAVTTPEVTSKSKLLDDYGCNDKEVLAALVQAKLGEFVDVPDHLV